MCVWLGQEESAKVRRAVESQTLPPGLEVALVRDFLVHHAYSRALAAYDASMQASGGPRGPQALPVAGPGAAASTIAAAGPPSVSGALPRGTVLSAAALARLRARVAPGTGAAGPTSPTAFSTYSGTGTGPGMGTGALSAMGGLAQGGHGDTLHALPMSPMVRPSTQCPALSSLSPLTPLGETAAGAGAGAGASAGAGAGASSTILGTTGWPHAHLAPVSQPPTGTLALDTPSEDATPSSGLKWWLPEAEVGFRAGATWGVEGPTGPGARGGLLVSPHPPSASDSKEGGMGDGEEEAGEGQREGECKDSGEVPAPCATRSPRPHRLRVRGPGPLGAASAVGPAGPTMHAFAGAVGGAGASGPPAFSGARAAASTGAGVFTGAVAGAGWMGRYAEVHTPGASLPVSPMTVPSEGASPSMHGGGGEGGGRGRRGMGGPGPCVEDEGDGSDGDSQSGDGSDGDGDLGLGCLGPVQVCVCACLPVIAIWRCAPCWKSFRK